MSNITFKFANSNESTPPPDTTSFVITASPQTDIWKKLGPPAVSRFSAPILYKAIPVSSFLRIRATISATWTTQDDHGGLIFVLPQDDGSMKWVKTGIELIHGQTFIATGSADRGADMSLSQTGLRGEKREKVTLEMIKENKALWIYVVDGEMRIPIRQVTWILSGDLEGVECWVGIFAARPRVSEQGEDAGLVVKFEKFELDIL